MTPLEDFSNNNWYYDFDTGTIIFTNMKRESKRRCRQRDEKTCQCPMLTVASRPSLYNKPAPRKLSPSQLLLLSMFVVVWSTLTSCNVVVSASADEGSVITNNYAVIVSASRYWFNYRHATNAFAMYNVFQENHIPAKNIVLMIADDYSTNPRNPIANSMYNTASKYTNTKKSLYSDTTSSNQYAPMSIDYRGEDVTIKNLLQVLSGRKSHYGNPHQKVLRTTSAQPNERVQNNLFLYLTGHGGDEFFKFQDIEEITSLHIKHVLQQITSNSSNSTSGDSTVSGGSASVNTFDNILLLADTCQAHTLGTTFQKAGSTFISSSSSSDVLRNVGVIGTSLQGQSSYAHKTDGTLGLSVVEKYTHYFTEHIHEHTAATGSRIFDQSIFDTMIRPFSKSMLGADIGYDDTAMTSPFTKLPLSTFFGGGSSKVPVPQSKNKDTIQLLSFDTSPTIRVDRPYYREGGELFASAAVSPTTLDSNSGGSAATLFVLQQYHDEREGMEPNDPLFLITVLLFGMGLYYFIK